MPLEADLTELPNATRAQIHKLVTDEGAAQIMQARIRQARIAQFYHKHRPRAIEGMGGQEMAIDPFWLGYFNMMHGRHVWADPDFRKWLAKEEEAFRVRSSGTRIQVGWAPTNVMFRKRYEPDGNS